MVWNGKMKWSMIKKYIICIIRTSLFYTMQYFTIFLNITNVITKYFTVLLNISQHCTIFQNITNVITKYFSILFNITQYLWTVQNTIKYFPRLHCPALHCSYHLKDSQCRNFIFSNEMVKHSAHSSFGYLYKKICFSN